MFNVNEKQSAVTVEVKQGLDYQVGDVLGGFLACVNPPKIGKVNIASFYSSDIEGSADSILALAIERHKGMYVKVSVYGFKREDGSLFEKVNGKQKLIAEFIARVEPVEIKAMGNIAKFSGCSIVDNDEIASKLSVTEVKKALVQVIIQYAGEEPPINGVAEIKTEVELDEELAKRTLTDKEEKIMEELRGISKSVEESLRLGKFFTHAKVLYSLYDLKAEAPNYEERANITVGLFKEHLKKCKCPVAKCQSNVESIISFTPALLADYLKPLNFFGLCEQHAKEYKDEDLLFVEETCQGEYLKFAQKSQNEGLKHFVLKRIRKLTTGDENHYIHYGKLLELANKRNFQSAIPLSTGVVGETFLEKEKSINSVR